MLRIGIRFVSEKGIEAKLIEFFEGGSQFCHVEFVFRDKATQELLGIDKPYVGAHAKGGVAAYDDSYYVGGNTITRFREYELDVTEEQFADLITFIKKRFGRPYDFLDIFGIMLHRPWHESNDFICSAFVAAALYHIAIYALNVRGGFLYKITPEILHLSPIWRGRLVKMYP